MPINLLFATNGVVVHSFYHDSTTVYLLTGQVVEVREILFDNVVIKHIERKLNLFPVIWLALRQKPQSFLLCIAVHVGQGLADSGIARRLSKHLGIRNGAQLKVMADIIYIIRDNSYTSTHSTGSFSYPIPHPKQIDR